MVFWSWWDMDDFSAGEALEEHQLRDDTTTGARAHLSFEGSL
jgi:hypothetical protein